MSLNLRVHERDKKNPALIAKFRPYVRLSQKDEIPIFFQDGRFWYEDSSEITDPPEWAVDQMNNLDKKLKQQLKYRDVKDGND